MTPISPLASLCRRSAPAPPWLLSLLLLWLLACPAASGSNWPDDGDFDDHTVPRLDSAAQFEALAARNETGTAVVKFVIVGFAEPDPGREHIRYLDGRFYEFHDQWYWFRLLNGHAVPGTRERPLSGPGFADLEEIRAWVRARRGPPPLGMRFVDDRLYSDYFYELAIHRQQRVLGVGTLVHLPARTHPEPRDEIWAFELEYGDAIEADALAHFFAALRQSLPPQIGDELRWIARSPAQERLVARIRGRDHELAPRVLTYAELAVPGEVQVYNPGLIAGRLRKLPPQPERVAALLAEGDEDAIWMMASVPDELPTGAGLLTGVPQTPLAHVNLLARNRGIPNVYLGGLMDDPQLDQLARVHAPVVLLAERDGTMRIEPIGEDAYARWLGMARPRVPTLTAVDVGALPYTLDLEAVQPEQVPELRPVIGGKAAGFPFLAATLPADARPERPLAITVRAYAEHIAELRPLIAEVMLEPGFTRDGRRRYLLLEGQKKFEKRFTSEADQRWLTDYLSEHPRDDDRKLRRDPAAALLARGGIQQAIRDKPLAGEAKRAIDAALQAHFGHFAATQGLRFRSSSTVEDLEGFSGAGLYDSNTGFLQAETLSDPKDQERGVDWALRKTWASYWSWEAFEERRTVGIEHLAGNMAVVVHARFDDPRERNNGVITVTIDRAGDRRGALQRPSPDRADMEVDVQLGSLSVTNPPPDRAGEVLPEVDRVRRDGDGGVHIERLAISTETGGAALLDDAALTQLLDQAEAIAERWLAVENLSLDGGRSRGSVTLDLEFRGLEPGWPAYADGRVAPARIVIKQARSLDPGVPLGGERLLDQPIPRDLLIHADRIERRVCQSARARVEVIEVRTDPMHQPDLGHGSEPFLARIRLQARGIPGEPRNLDLDHREFVTVDHASLSQGGPWSLRLDLDPTVAPAVGVDLDRVVLEAGVLRLLRGGTVLLEEPGPCALELMLSSPQVYLRSLLGL